MQRVTQPLAGSARKGPRASNLNGVPSWPKRERERERDVGFERKKKKERRNEEEKEKKKKKKKRRNTEERNKKRKSIVHGEGDTRPIKR